MKLKTIKRSSLVDTPLSEIEKMLESNIEQLFYIKNLVHRKKATKEEVEPIRLVLKKNIITLEKRIWNEQSLDRFGNEVSA